MRDLERLQRLHKENPLDAELTRVLVAELERRGDVSEAFWVRVRHKAEEIRRRPYWKRQGLGVGRERYLKKTD